MTTIKTADLHLELPRPTPPDTVVGQIVVAGCSNLRNLWPLGHFGFCSTFQATDEGKRRPEEERFGILTRDDKVHVGSFARPVSGPWVTYDEALDAAWQAYAAAMAATIAGQFDRMVDALEPIEKAAALAAEARRIRAIDLHQCDHCRTTFRGQAPAYLVLEEHTLVDVENSTGTVVYSGEASGWAPALASSLTARFRDELVRQQAEHSREVTRLQAEHATEVSSLRWWVRALEAVALVFVLVLAYSCG